MIKKYRKKPVVIEAMKITDICEQSGLIAIFMNSEFDISVGMDIIYIPTLEGTMEAKVGDYLIKGIKGEFYPCKPDIFEATYEEVKGENK